MNRLFLLVICFSLCPLGISGPTNPRDCPFRLLVDTDSPAPHRTSGELPEWYRRYQARYALEDANTEIQSTEKTHERLTAELTAATAAFERARSEALRLRHRLKDLRVVNEETGTASPASLEAPILTAAEANAQRLEKTQQALEAELRAVESTLSELRLTQRRLQNNPTRPPAKPVDLQAELLADLAVLESELAPLQNRKLSKTESTRRNQLEKDRATLLEQIEFLRETGS